MATHQFDPNSLPDDSFVQGELKHLVVGNECRLLDRRRTPGRIGSIDIEGGFFRWEISNFEDKGKFWDVEFEGVSKQLGAQDFLHQNRNHGMVLSV